MKYFLLLLIIPFQLLAQDINKFDEKGKRHGLWKGVHEESKRPRYEGTFEHGKEVGMFKYFDDTRDGTVIATRDFSAKDNSCYVIFYNQQSMKVSEGKVIDKKFEGEWKYYHLNSKNIMTTEHYSKGKLEGIRTVFYNSGKIAEEISYKNNLKNGFYKKYTENGIVLEESTFKNNLYSGLAVFRDSNGNLVSTGQFVNGKKAGIWQFFEKGKVVKEMNMSFPENATKSKL